MWGREIEKGDWSSSWGAEFTSCVAFVNEMDKMLLTPWKHEGSWPASMLL